MRVLWLIAVILILGCRTNSLPADKLPKDELPAESLAEQLAAVREGRSDEIRLEHTALGPQELESLAELASLRALVLDAGIVKDSDVKYLTALTGLEHLRLRDSPLSDIGIKELADGQLQSLRILNLPQARPTAIGLRELARLPKLRQLRIAGRQIDDAAIEELAKWPALSSLHLIQPGMTDRSLVTLASMQELSSLYIDECPLSDAAWSKFFASRPGLHVHIDQAHHDLDPNVHP